MRVLVVTTWFPSKAHDGSGIFNLRDTELLAKDHSVHVIHLIRRSLMSPGEAAHETLESGITVQRVAFDWKRPSDWLVVRKTIRHAVKRYDMFHTMAFPSLTAMTLVRPKLPWVHTEHWSGLVRYSANFLKRQVQKLMRTALKRPDTVVAVSDFLGENIARITRQKPFTIGNNVVFPANSEVVSRWQPDQEIRLISVASVAVHKGPEEAVRAVKQLRDAGTAVKLTWIGRGDLIDEMRQLVRDLDLLDHVDFLGSVEPSEVSKYLLESHIFLLPTVGETFGVAIAEALAVGLPVVVTGTGGHTEFVNDRVGRVAERTAKKLAAAMTDLLHDNALASPREISQYAKDLFSEVSRQEKYRHVYAKAMNSG